MKTMLAIAMLMVCAISIQAQTLSRLKTQLAELLPKIKDQQQKVQEANKAYANAVVPRIKSGADREKVGWYYTGDPQAVFPMSEYDNRQKGRGYDARIKYKSYTPAELAAEVKAAKEKLDAEKKILANLQAQLKKLREALKSASK
jgi:multidrug resistance efflux pump